MLSVYLGKQFRKDLKKAEKANKDLSILEKVFDALVKETPLDQKLKDHPLKGTLINCRECHLQPDWLLIYKIENNTLILIRTGTHSELY